jgi:arylsulfatase A-like enzyme
MLGLNPRTELDGRSLAGIIRGQAPDGYELYDTLFTESFAFDRIGYQHYGKTYAILKDRKKLIYSPYAYPYAPIYQYYNLEVDPGEDFNLFDTDQVSVEELRLLLEKWVDADETPERVLSGRVEQEVLKSLQYIN